MAQNKRSYEITCKVKFLDEYHDIAIEVNYWGYHCGNPQRIYEQIVSITGMSSECIRAIHCGYRDRLSSERFHDGDCFHLYFYIHRNFPYENESKAMRFIFFLLPIDEVPEGVCSLYVCQHTNTKALFNKMKELVENDELNIKILDRVMAEDWNIDKVSKEFNIQQYFQMECKFRLDNFDSFEISRRVDLYLRTRG